MLWADMWLSSRGSDTPPGQLLHSYGWSSRLTGSGVEGRVTEADWQPVHPPDTKPGPHFPPIPTTALHLLTSEVTLPPRGSSPGAEAAAPHPPASFITETLFHLGQQRIQPKDSMSHSSLMGPRSV